MPVRTDVVIPLAGAWLPGWVATLTASPPRVMKLIVFGSVLERARDDRAKLMHGWLPVVVPFMVVSALMPAEDPSGRGRLQVELPLLSWIGSPIAPLVGL